jgi:competence protein ComEC
MNAARDATATTTKGATVPIWSLPLPAVVMLMLLLIASQQPDGRLHLWVLDVGQGDAILVRSPGGHTALIDGGPAATPLLNGIGERLPFWQRDLDLLVLTHPHQDHMMGFIEVLGRYRVDQVVQTHFTSTVGVQAEWLSAIGRRGIPVHYPRKGDTISFEGEPEVTLRVLHPASPYASYGLTGDDLNEASIALQLTYGNQSLLLAGDIQANAEGELARSGEDIYSRVLKVAHHGSDSSSTLPFLDAVRPQVAVISVGEANKFGHPSQKTIEALEKAGALVYRTDQNGTVEIIAGEDSMWVRSER